MALDINTLRKAREGAEYVSDVRICVTADGRLVDEKDPEAVSLLVGAGSSIPVDLARQYGLIVEDEPEGAEEDRNAGDPRYSSPAETGGLEAKTVAELRELAEARGVDLTGASRKAEIISRLEAAPDGAEDEPESAEEA